MARDYTAGTHLGTTDVAALYSLLTGNLSVAFWVNFASGVSANRVLWYLGTYNTNGWGLLATTASGRAIQAWMSPSTILGGHVVPNTDQWYHYAMVRNGTAWTQYLNAAPDAGPTNTPNAPSGGGYLMGDVSGCFARMAEVALWKTNLSAADIAALAKGFAAPMVQPQHLVSYWPLRSRTSPEPDLRASRNAGLAGTAPYVDHPRIIVPRPAIYLP